MLAGPLRHAPGDRWPPREKISLVLHKTWPQILIKMIVILLICISIVITLILIILTKQLGKTWWISSHPFFIFFPSHLHVFQHLLVFLQGAPALCLSGMCRQDQLNLLRDDGGANVFGAHALLEQLLESAFKAHHLNMEKFAWDFWRVLSGAFPAGF